MVWKSLWTAGLPAHREHLDLGQVVRRLGAQLRIAIVAPLPDRGQERQQGVVGGVPADLAADIALDLRNSVDTIDRKWMTEPKADLTPMVDGLRTQVITRSQGLDASGNLRMTVSARDALLASIAQLRTSTIAAAAA